jgi:hypothetical protein
MGRRQRRTLEGRRLTFALVTRETLDSILRIR